MPPNEFDASILDDPDPPESLPESVITLGSLPLTTVDRPPPSPIYSSTSSPSRMEVEDDFEDYIVAGPLSPQKEKHTTDVNSNDKEEVFVFEDEKKFFESVVEAFETKIGDPSVCQVIVNIVSVLGRDEGYTVKYNPLPEGVTEGEARGSCR